MLVRSWRAGADRRAIVAATATSRATLGLSAYLIRSINIPLLNGAVNEAARPELISRWYRGNAIRLCLLASTEMLMRKIEVSANSVATQRD